jgi:mercuric ion binding protein
VTSSNFISDFLGKRKISDKVFSKMDNMKTKFISIATVFLLLGTICFSATEEKKETFKVFGNGMESKVQIESTALSVKGVVYALWDEQTKVITVVYNVSKTDIQEIQKTIAETGYDTGNIEASDEAYNKLPLSCRYR